MELLIFAVITIIVQFSVFISISKKIFLRNAPLNQVKEEITIKIRPILNSIIMKRLPIKVSWLKLRQ